jgi:hypothetical protein
MFSLNSRSCLIALTAASAIAASGCGGSSTYTDDQFKALVIDTCQGSVKNQLKDPDSVKFGDDWKSWIVTNSDKPPKVADYKPENGDKLFSAGGSVNAKNSFGGYVGDQPYGCDAVATTGNEITAVAYPLDEILSPTG